MDVLCHINNTIYFHYMKQVCIESLQQIGCDVEVKPYVGAIGRSSFEASYQIHLTDMPDVMFAEGSAKIVWVDIDPCADSRRYARCRHMDL